MTSNPTFTVTVRGVSETFTSAFADLASAWKALDASANKTEFANSLLQAARERRCSSVQVAWIHKLATERASRNTAGVRVDSLDLRPVFEMMVKAAEAQKRFPRIVLRTANGQDVMLKFNGKSMSIQITDGRPFGENTYFGKAEMDGAVVRSRHWNPDVEQLLRNLAADPAKVAGQHGVATGSCCFCNTPLSTAESRSVGYGPVCATKFGLPWGDTSVADLADAAAKEAFAAERDQRDADYESDCMTQEGRRNEERAHGDDSNIFDRLFAGDVYPSGRRYAGD